MSTTESYTTESTMPFYARQAESGRRLHRQTRHDQRDRTNSYQEKFSTLSIFDFNQDTLLQSQLKLVEIVTRNFLTEKLNRLGLLTTGIDKLKPIYVNTTEFDETGTKTSGYVLWNGLIVVEVDADDPLETAMTASHELSHASRGLIHDYHRGQSGRDHIRGLYRYYYKTMTREGNLLENGMSVWDTADMYNRFKSKKIFGESTSLRHESLEHISSSEFLDTDYGRELHNIISKARQIGIPDALLEPYVYSSSNLFNITIMWRIARLIGRYSNTSVQSDDVQTIVQNGRDILEISRFTGTRQAHEYIENIFREDAPTILSAGDHPDNFKEIIVAVEKAERRIGIIH